MAYGRTAEDIESEIAEAAQRIADNLASLITEVHPKAVLHRTIEEGKRKVYESVEDARQFAVDAANLAKDKFEAEFKDEDGWQWKKLAIAGGVAAAVVVVSFGLRVRVR